MRILTSSLNTYSCLLFYLTFFLVFSYTVASSASSPTVDTLAINEEEKACGSFRGSVHNLPTGWKVAEVISRVTLETPFGTCSDAYVNNNQYYSQCCKDLGFEYLDYKGIPYTSELVEKFEEDGWACNIRAGKSYFEGVLINEEVGKCTTLVDFVLNKENRTAWPTEGQCSIEDESWVAYEYNQEGVRNLYVDTIFGKCKYNFSNVNSCCQELGLTNVGEITASKERDRFPLILGTSIIILIGAGIVLLKQKEYI